MAGDPVDDLRRLAELVDAGRAEATLALADQLEGQGVASPTIDKARANAWTILARAWRESGDRAGAADAGEKIIALAPQWSTGWYELATDYFATGRLAEAIATVEHFIKLEPNQGDGWYNLACYRCAAGDRDGAIAALDLAVGLAPENARIAVDDTDFAPIRSDPRFIAITA